MKYTTGLPTPKFADLLIRLREEGIEGYPPSLGLRDSLRAALIYMRHNVIQAAIGEQLGVSQPTVSRAIGVMTEAIVRALKCLNMALAWSEWDPLDLGRVSSRDRIG